MSHPDGGTEPIPDGGTAPGGATGHIAAGGHHTCAVLADATLRCWGAGNASQLGQGRSGSSSVAIPVPGISDVAQIALGYEFTCARTKAGAASCWGANPGGSLGNGGVDAKLSPTPVSLQNLQRFADFALGHWNNCAMHANGRLSCWGDNTRGQLGLGTVDSEDHPMPAELPVSGVERLALGYFHGCAGKSDGTVYCWGSNGWGEVGNGTLSSDPVPMPSLVNGIDHVTQLAAGQQWSCGILQDRRVSCWGDNRNGQLGDGTTTFRTKPTTINGLTDITQIAAGRKHACALKGDGTLFCWGRNTEGQLGDDTTTDRYMPTQVPGLTGVTEVALGDVHTCASLGSGEVRCFGSNSDGQLGDGTTTDRKRPTPVVWK